MADSLECLYISNMKRILAIQSYSLFGESAHLPDVMHCETIAERSRLHDWELSPHRHAHLHQVLLIQAGGGTASLDGVAHKLVPGSLVNVPTGHVHAFRFRRNTQGWVATLPVELLDEILVHVGDVRSGLAQADVVNASPAIQLLMQQMWEEFCARSKARALVLKGLSSTLLGLLARAMAEGTPNHAKMREFDLVQRFKALIQEHFLEHWSVADYASALSVSSTHLSRLTRAATGDSALRLIEARTLREARRYLAYTHLNIATIAYELGFKDPAYFTRAFSRDGGLSPRAFRAQLGELATKTPP
jgi:AraC family transcriptional regulator, transcriptional activator of pobA